jgi:hypothetical protein
VTTLIHRLATELVAHERDDERQLVPLVAKALGSVEATAALSLEHAEIEQRVNRLQHLITAIGSTGAAAEDVVEIRRNLYELHAILQLHNANEEEGASSLGVPA